MIKIYNEYNKESVSLRIKLNHVRKVLNKRRDLIDFT